VLAGKASRLLIARARNQDDGTCVNDHDIGQHGTFTDQPAHQRFQVPKEGQGYAQGDVKPCPIRFFGNTRGKAMDSKTKEPRNFRDVKDRSFGAKGVAEAKGGDVKKKILVKNRDSGKGWKGIETVVSFRDSPVHLAEMVVQ
jgi:hypothetical protein